MPVITFDGPRLGREQKEQLVREFAETASRVTKLPVDKFITLLKESDPENVGVGTDLLANRQRG